jgi:hypothetical protein
MASCSWCMGLSRLFESKGRGKATMACLATTRLRGAGG